MSLKVSQELKGLESRLTKLKAEKSVVDTEFANVAGRQSNVNAQIQAIRQEMDALKKSVTEIIITEHAIIRFMERAMGLDVNQIRAQILSASVQSMIRNGGNGKYPIGIESLKAVVRDGSVVTID